jgi:hypothetical protein
MRSSSSTSLLAAVAASLAAGPARADEPEAAAAAGQVDASATAAETKADEIPDLDKIRAPDSPAFVLLGVSPTEIQRPTTPTELSVALGSFVSQGSLVVPDSLAVEVAPYWLVSHPKLTGAAMATSSVPEALLRNFTVSLATTTRTLTVDDGMGGTVDQATTDMALGLRSRWLDGRGRVACWADVEAAAQAIVREQGAVVAAEAVAIGARYPVRSIPDRASRAEREAIDRENAAALAAQAVEIDLVRARELEKAVVARKRLAEVALKCVEASAARTGLVGDAALAASLRFPDRSFGDGEWLAAGGWVTLAAQGVRHDLVGIGRLLADRSDGDADLVVDAGARYIHVRGRYALSGELLYRFLTEEVDDQHLIRVDIAVEVRVYGKSWLTATFGRDFAAPDAGEVFALANVKWGFGGPGVELSE